MRKYLKSFLILGMVLNLFGCSGVDFKQWHFPYMMEVDQGTYISILQYKQLKIGMTKDQVVEILGYPLVQFMFNQNRWDFMYQEYTNDQLKKSYSVTIFFDKKTETIINIVTRGKLFKK